MKTVLVTGGAKGIGAEICRTLAKEGYAVAVNYRSSVEISQKLVAEIKENGGIAEAFQGDVGNSADVKRIVKEVKNTFGDIQYLVNNAGIAMQKLITDVTDEEWEQMIDSDLSGAFYCCREVLPSMIHSHFGKIVNIASMWGEAGASMEVPYSAAKAGVIGLTKALAKEVGLSGITVNAVSPGVIMTDMMATFSEEDVNSLKEETPLNTLGTPKNVADAVSFLFSDTGDFITGQIISVNGGFVI